MHVHAPAEWFSNRRDLSRHLHDEAECFSQYGRMGLALVRRIFRGLDNCAVVEGRAKARAAYEGLSGLLCEVGVID
jgi:hypothetical protein